MTRSLCQPKLLDLKSAGGKLYPLLSTIQRHTKEPIWLTGSALRNAMVESKSDPDDIDLIFFSNRDVSKAYEKEVELELIEKTGYLNLSVKNQARITAKMDGCLYENLFQSVDAFPDTSVAMAVRVIDFRTKLLSFYVPYGLSYLNSECIHPTKSFISRHSLAEYYHWLERKDYEYRLPNWQVRSNVAYPTNAQLRYFVSCQ